MKTFITIFLFSLFIFFACNRTPDKPKLTLSEYSKQAVITKGVIEKILAETDYKKMHQIALAVESSRAVDCTTINEECNLYGQILNKIVECTQTRLPNAEENVIIYRKLGEMDAAFIKGHEMLAEQWKAYIAATHPEDQKEPPK